MENHEKHYNALFFLNKLGLGHKSVCMRIHAYVNVFWNMFSGIVFILYANGMEYEIPLANEKTQHRIPGKIVKFKKK